MVLFGIGNILMKYKRKQLPRMVKAWWSTVFIGIVFVAAGLIGNIIFDISIVEYFAIYFSVTILVIYIMFTRVRIFKFMVFFLNDVAKNPNYVGRWVNKYLLPWSKQKAREIKNQPMAFFAKTDELSVMNKAILYVMENEITDNLKIVHVYESEEGIPPLLESHVSTLDETYPKLQIDLILIQGKFTPTLVNNFSDRLNIPKNLIFITCPSSQFMFKINEFGGIRVITH
jgi:hypothetical protein